MTHYLIFANGDVADGPMVRRALHQAQQPVVLAADGGARAAAHFGLAVDLVIGDFDSLSEAEQQRLSDAGAAFHRHPVEKDCTDLELALKHAAAQDAPWIRVIGGLGDRFDQTMANVYLLALPELDGRDVRLVAGRQDIRLLKPGTHPIRGQVGDTVSLLPIGGAATGIHTSGLYYPLDDEPLTFGPARGISNVLTETEASVRIGEGLLLLIHTDGRA